MSTQPVALGRGSALPATSPAAPFANYQQLSTGLPAWGWWTLRTAVMTLALGFLAWAVLAPRQALPLFWGLLVPSVPMVLVLAPGLWRQVCPMAMLNQLPRTFGFSLGKTLPDSWQKASFGVAVGLFVAAISLRVPCINQHGQGLCLLLTSMFAAAFVGGVVFKGRSGWCGTFCPLGPIQRAYGHAPLSVVKNGYCPSCVGCQQHCYDFNPQSAIFQDLEADDPRHAQWRQWFFGLLPGLILGFFLQGPRMPDQGWWHYEATLVGASLCSLGLYALLSTALPLRAYRLSLIFAVAALALFYAFTGPGIITRLAGLAGFAAPTWLQLLGACAGSIVGISLVVQGLRNEQLHRRAVRAQRKAEARRKAQWQAITIQRTTVTDRADGKKLSAEPGQKLADVLRSQGKAVPKGCGAGVCGGDAIAICEGMDKLPPPCEQELATLKRMGLEGRARLACVCEVTAPITIDTRRQALQAPPQAAAPDAADPLRERDIQRVVVIGNGIAGVTMTEALRRLSGSVHLTLISDEDQPFYNRMALAEVIHDPAASPTLHLREAQWAPDWRIDLLRGVRVQAIDRTQRTVQLQDGRSVAYDRLVLATGADAARPGDTFDQAPNAFVLRTMADAEAIHAHIQAQHARRAVVVGGGVLGVEAALALRQAGLSVALVERAPRLMAAQLDDEGAARLSDALAQRGIVVHTGIQQTEWLDRQDRRLRALLLDGALSLDADLFVACLGIRPRTALAEAAGLRVQARGIEVDTCQVTSDPRILAIGDVALSSGPAGLWPTATAQAERAVQGLLGETPNASEPAVLLKLKSDEIDVQAWGVTQPALTDEVWLAEEDDPMHWRVIWRQGKLAGWMAVGKPGQARQVELAVQSGCPQASRAALDAL